jgi:hypothetical protein
MKKSEDSLFMPLSRFLSLKNTLSDSKQLSIIQFNRSQRTILAHKVEWEIELKKKLNNYDGILEDSLSHIVNRTIILDISDEDALDTIITTLKKNYQQSLKSNCTALAAYIYLHLINFEVLAGYHSITPATQNVKTEFNISYQNYIQTLEIKAIQNKKIFRKN